ncbi:MAG: MATE family efflux transporter [Ruminococcaceae bacterium]|nr:MATE family efflux transporter [Oscillospiraceae bacterium]
MGIFEKDLSKGNVGKQLWMFALPFILSNLIQSLYSVVDMIIVGRFSGSASMSGVNIGGQITLLITNLVIGLCAGGTTLIAQYMGGGARKALKETIGTLLTTLVLLGIVLTVGMALAKEPLLRMVQTPQDAFSEANNYLFITALGTLFIFGYNALSAIMRGMGDSRNPLLFVGIACVINVFLDLLLVAHFDMKATGAAVATVVSQAVSMVLCIFYLKRNNFIFDFNFSSFRFHKERLKMLMKVGIPTSVQNVIVSISFLFLTSLVNTMGVTESAALGAVAKFNGFAILPALAMSASIAAMSGQNLGAGETERAVKTMKLGTTIGFLMSLAIFLVAQLIPEKVLGIFAEDAAMIAAGKEYMRSFSFDYLLASLLFGLNGLFIGSGHTTFTLFNSVLSSILFRVPMAYIGGIVLPWGMFGFGLAGPVSSFVALLLAVGFYKTGKWKKTVVFREGDLRGES